MASMGIGKSGSGGRDDDSPPGKKDNAFLLPPSSLGAGAAATTMMTPVQEPQIQQQSPLPNESHHQRQEGSQLSATPVATAAATAAICQDTKESAYESKSPSVECGNILQQQPRQGLRPLGESARSAPFNQAARGA
uniref:Uncharacterized protein n=1 Tax=Pseudictyota dubia TaxID=2749911 RepID=A0A7R9Z253_9STRA